MHELVDVIIQDWYHELRCVATQHNVTYTYRAAAETLQGVLSFMDSLNSVPTA